jgi:phage N-6-adenine-methyltransferase
MSLSWIFGGFTLDPCATKANAKCARFFTTCEDGLTQRWEGKVFVNPPYGRAIGSWVRKAFEASREGALVVCLLPARTDALVAGVRPARPGVVSARSPEVRASEECGALSERRGDFR